MRNFISRYVSGQTLFFFGTVLLAGCASPGVPRPPSLHLPSPVRDLLAKRIGTAVDLTFTAPEQSTDHQSLSGKHGGAPLLAVLCRVDAGGCVDVQRLPASPGAVYQVHDALPPGLTIGPARPLHYRIRVLNVAGRDAGPSRDAVAAAGEAPPPLVGLRATNVAEGVQLRWQPAPGPAGVVVEAVTQPSGADKSATNRRLQPAGGPAQRDPGGAVDTAPLPGSHVTYTVFRQTLATVAGERLLLTGLPSTVTAERAADTFPPAVPTGLLALLVPGPNDSRSIDLSWEPNGEPDLAGYLVFRASGDSPAVRLTTQPVRTISFTDTTARPGERYRYTVVAVDRTGNESGPSAPAAIALPAASGS